VEIVSHAGRVILTGWPKNDTLMPTGTITKKEIDIRGARTSAGEFEEAVDLIYHDRIPVKKILTRWMPSTRLPNTIIDIESNPETTSSSILRSIKEKQLFLQKLACFAGPALRCHVPVGDAPPRGHSFMTADG
jgi:hypothetical protein